MQAQGDKEILSYPFLVFVIYVIDKIRMLPKITRLTINPKRKKKVGMWFCIIRVSKQKLVSYRNSIDTVSIQYRNGIETETVSYRNRNCVFEYSLGIPVFCWLCRLSYGWKLWKRNINKLIAECSLKMADAEVPKKVKVNIKTANAKLHVEVPENSSVKEVWIPLCYFMCITWSNLNYDTPPVRKLVNISITCACEVYLLTYVCEVYLITYVCAWAESRSSLFENIKKSSKKQTFLNNYLNIKGVTWLENKVTWLKNRVTCLKRSRDLWKGTWLKISIFRKKGKI